MAMLNFWPMCLGRSRHQRKLPVLQGIARKKEQERKCFGSNQNIFSKEDLRGKTAQVSAVMEQRLGRAHETVR